jgi:hypothetical protein
MSVPLSYDERRQVMRRRFERLMERIRPRGLHGPIDHYARIDKLELQVSMLCAYIQGAGVPDIPGLSDALHEIAEPWAHEVEGAYGAMTTDS